MKKLVVIMMVLLACSASAQQNQCGTSFADQTQTRDRLRANISYAERNGIPENAIMYVPVFFHLTAKSDGTSRASMPELFNALCTMNRDYAQHDIQFYMAPHPTLGLVDRTISSDGVYNEQTNTFAMNFKRHNNAVNYYLVGTASTNNSQPGGAAAYYSPARDWVVINKSYTTFGDNTIAHETGHFFSLAHTFYGWEADAEDWQNQPPCFESADPGWPCAPLTYNGTPVEKMDGSNCSVASDLICDTPPDYNFGYCASNSCAPYNGGAKDANCVLVNPMENNFMSYFFNCADYEFTPQQIDAVKADILSPSRNFLDNSFTPAATVINTPDDMLVSPTEAQVVAGATTATLTWNAVPGATYYYVEYDRTLTFSGQLGGNFTVTGTSVDLTGLTANKKYYWRVRPFNEYYVCATTKQRSFTTNAASGVDQIDAVNEWSVSPNPVDADLPVSITIQSTSSLIANISIIDLTGRVLFSENNVPVNPGQTTVQMPTTQLSNGVYFVRMENNGQIETKRLVVAK